MGKFSKQKGIRGEKLWAETCQQAGFLEVHRVGQQMYQTGAEVADCVGLPGIHQEVKFQERLALRAAMEQSQRDSKAWELPIVAHRSLRKPWLVTMLAKDWFQLYKAWKPLF
jgi:hypothetical protein